MTPDAVSIINRTRCLNLVCLMILFPKEYCYSYAYSQRNITVPRPARTCRRFLLHSHRFQKRSAAYRSGLYTYRVYFVVSKLEEHVYPRSSCHFVRSKDQNKRCAQDKNSKRADLGKILKWLGHAIFVTILRYLKQTMSHVPVASSVPYMVIKFSM